MLSETWQCRDISLQKWPINESTAKRKRKHDGNVIPQAKESVEQNGMRRFYETVKGVLIKTAPSLVICHYNNGILLTDTTIVDARLREHLEILLNGGKGRAIGRI